MMSQYTVRKHDGELIGPLTKNQVLQLIKSGQVQMYDMIAEIGKGFQPIKNYPSLVKLCPDQSEVKLPQESFSGQMGAIDLLRGLQPVKILYPDLNHPEKRGITYAGELQRICFARIYYILHIYRLTGRLLLIRSNSATREIYFLRGIPWIIKLPTEDDDLPERLLSKKLCTSEQIEQCLNLTVSQGKQLSDHLAMMNFVAANSLYEVLQEQFRDRLLGTFHWQDGRYLFYADERPIDSGIPLNLDNFNTIKDGIYSAYDLHFFEQKFEPHYHHKVNYLSNPHALIEHIRLSPQEARIYTQIKRSETLWTMITNLKNINITSVEEILRFIYFLGVIDLIQIDKQTLWPMLTSPLSLPGNA